MGKVDEAKKQLIRLLQDGKDVEIEYLIRELGVKKRRLQQLRSEIASCGYVIKKGTKKGTWCMSVEDSCANFRSDGNIPAQEAGQSSIEDAILAVYLFVLHIHGGKLNIDDMYVKLRTPRKDEEDYVSGINREHDENGIPSGIRAVTSKSFMGRIRLLAEQGYIEVDSERNVILKNDNIRFLPVMSLYTEEDDASQLQEKLELYETSDEQLQEIVKSISRIYSGEITDREIVYERRRRWSDKSRAVKLIRDRLGSVDYRNKACSVTMTGKSGKEHTIDIKIGMLLYSEYQNELYMLGDRVGIDTQRSVVEIVVSRIKEIHELDMANDLYSDETEIARYNDIYDKMFGVEYTAPVSVEVMFEDYGNIGEKIMQLASTRRTAEVSEQILEDGKKVLIYTDTVIGIHDFAAYLRQYGSSCKVIQPASLAKILKTSSEKIINRYSIRSDSVMENDVSGEISTRTPGQIKEWRPSAKKHDFDVVERILSLYVSVYPTVIFEDDMEGISLEYLGKMCNIPLSTLKNDIYNMLKARNRTNCAVDLIISADKGEVEIERNRESEVINKLDSDSTVSMVLDSEFGLSMKAYVALDSKKIDFLRRFEERYVDDGDRPFMYVGKIDYRLSHEYNAYPVITRRIYKIIKEAIDNGDDVSFDYRKHRNSHPEHVTITPMKIVEYGSFGTVYVVTVKYKEIRAFRLDRIDETSIRTVSVPGRYKNIDPESKEALKNLNCVWDMDLRSGELDVVFKVYNDIDGKVIGKARRDLAQYIDSGGYETEYDSQGNMIVRGHVIGKNSFKRFARGYGASLVIMSPEDLAGEMIESAEKRLALYI